MKKIIGILGVVVIAATIFMNSNSNLTSDFNLSNLTALNSANAEDSCSGTGCEQDCTFFCYGSFLYTCYPSGGAYCPFKRAWNG